MTTAWFAWNMMNNGWRDDDERREREERNMAQPVRCVKCRCYKNSGMREAQICAHMWDDEFTEPFQITPLDPTPYATGGSHNYNFEPEPRSEMRKYKVYLKSGTVITIAADEAYNQPGTNILVFRAGSDLVAYFVEWEGYQYLRPAPTKEPEKSGS